MMQLMGRITRRDRFLRTALRMSASLLVLVALSPLALCAQEKTAPTSIGGYQNVGPGQAGNEPEPAPEYEPEPAPEYKIKAAFLYKFTRYITWPDGCFSNDKSPIIIGVLGKDPFGDELDDILKGHTSDNRRFVVRRFKNVGEIDHCHLLFISRAERHRQKDYLKQLAGRPIVTVGESDGFLSSGGIINLITEDKVRFEVNKKGANDVGITISARMLHLAVKVIQTENTPSRPTVAGQQAFGARPGQAHHLLGRVPPRP
jgi:hypothetical protein